MPEKRAIVLLSGGLDSATCLALAAHDCCQPYCLTFDYGQTHRVEIQAAEQIAHSAGAHWRLLRLPLNQISLSSLTGTGDVPKNRDLEEASIPSTYVPGRNLVFLSIALGYAESIDAEAVYIGANSIDYSGYPDCRGEFFDAFRRVAKLGLKRGYDGQPIEVRTPLIDLTKKEIVELAMKHEVNIGLTRSCYAPRDDGSPCGECDSCRLRQRGFDQAGQHDSFNPSIS